MRSSLRLLGRQRLDLTLAQLAEGASQSRLGKEAVAFQAVDHRVEQVTVLGRPPAHQPLL